MTSLHRIDDHCEDVIEKAGDKKTCIRMITFQMQAKRLCCFRQLVFFYFVGVDLLGSEVKPFYFYQIFLEVLEYFHDFSVNLTADAIALLKQSAHTIIN